MVLSTSLTWIMWLSLILGPCFLILFCSAWLFSKSISESVAIGSNEVSLFEYFVLCSSLELLWLSIFSRLCETIFCFYYLSNYLNLVYYSCYPCRISFYLLNQFLECYLPSLNPFRNIRLFFCCCFYRIYLF